MSMIRMFVVAAIAAATTFTAAAQGLNAGQCILAGRLNDHARWAPRAQGVELLEGKGRVMKESRHEALQDVRQVRLTKPALLSKCNGDRDIARGGDEIIPKEPVPAIGPGLVEVEAVAFPKLRSGGELVELRVKVPLERVVMVKR